MEEGGGEEEGEGGWRNSSRSESFFEKCNWKYFGTFLEREREREMWNNTKEEEEGEEGEGEEEEEEQKNGWNSIRPDEVTF